MNRKKINKHQYIHSIQCICGNKKMKVIKIRNVLECSKCKKEINLEVKENGRKNN